MQERLRSLVPPPQVLPQGDQELQPLQPPCTTKMKNFHNLSTHWVISTLPLDKRESYGDNERKNVCVTVADPGEGPRGAPPLFLDQTEARRAEKNF